MPAARCLGNSGPTRLGRASASAGQALQGATARPFLVHPRPRLIQDVGSSGRVGPPPVRARGSGGKSSGDRARNARVQGRALTPRRYKRYALSNFERTRRICALTDLLEAERRIVDAVVARTLSADVHCTFVEADHETRVIARNLKGATASDFIHGKILATCVIKWRQRLDQIIGDVVACEAHELEPIVLQLLRVGIYELLTRGGDKGFQEAALLEAHNIAGSQVGPAASAFVVATINKVARLAGARQLPMPRVPERDARGRRALAETAVDIAARTSHPLWLVSRWVRRHGSAQTESLVAHNNSEPLNGVRVCVNRGVNYASVIGELRSLGVDVARSPYLPNDFLRVAGSLTVVQDAGLLKDAIVTSCDEASGLVVKLLDPKPGEDVACYARPGKTLFAAARMNGSGRLYAIGTDGVALRALSSDAVQQGASRHMRLAQCTNLEAAARGRVTITRASAEKDKESHRRKSGDGPRSIGDGARAAQNEEWPGQFHRVLLDVPCSGTGQLRGCASQRWLLQEALLPALVKQQAKLLDAAAKLVAPGGLLVYSTCSLEPEENMAQVAAFLERHPAFMPEPPLHGQVPLEVTDAAGCLQTLPFVHGIDGAFAVRLRHTPEHGPPSPDEPDIRVVPEPSMLPPAGPSYNEIFVRNRDDGDLIMDDR